MLEGPLGYAQQAEDLALEFGQFRIEDLDGAPSRSQGMALGQAEQAQDLLGGGSLALALLRVERKLGDGLPLHRQAQLALDQCLHQKGEEVESEQRLNAALVLEEHGRDLVHGLDLLEALLDAGLALVGDENLGRR